MVPCDFNISITAYILLEFDTDILENYFYLEWFLVVSSNPIDAVGWDNSFPDVAVLWWYVGIRRF